MRRPTAFLPLLLLLPAAGCQEHAILDGPPGGADAQVGDAPVIVLRTADALKDPKEIGTFTTTIYCCCIVPQGMKASTPLGDVVSDRLVRRIRGLGLACGYRPLAPSEAGSLPKGKILVSARILSWSYSGAEQILSIGPNSGKSKVELEVEVLDTASGNVLWKGRGASEETAEHSMGQANQQKDLEMVVKVIRGAVAQATRDPDFVSAVASREDEACDEMLRQASELERQGSSLAALEKATSALARARGSARKRDIFDSVARIYRSLPVKPALPEEARRHKVLATDALDGKRYLDAARSFRCGLAAAPWWTEGHFNAALLYAESGRFSEAVAHMRRYVALAPDATDARDAQDRIYLWEQKAGSSPSDPEEGTEGDGEDPGKAEEGGGSVSRELFKGLKKEKR